MILAVDDYDDEQVAQQQSTERHHSIIDWLSREAIYPVPQSNMTSTTIHSSIFSITNNK